MTIKIYVGNLSYQVSESELYDLFARFGKVESSKIITNPHTGRPRGFAFVEMYKRNEGFQAIRELNGKEVKGRRLKVNKAHSQKNRTNNLDRRTNRFAGRSYFQGGGARRNS